jgi:hypothetical protein
MGGNRARRLWSSNEEAVSEEYTALPALCTVVIGLALFFLLLAHAYTASQAQSETIHTYHTAELLTEKLLDPANSYMQPGGILDIASFTNAAEAPKQWQDYSPKGFDFLFRLTYNHTTITLPTNATFPPTFTAASRTIPISLSDAQTTPGTLTVILWRRQP